MTMDSMRNNYDVLMDKAFGFLDSDEPEKALRVGEQLEEMRYSGAFEIQALAYNDLDKRQQAINVLEKGVKKVPDLWCLWELLGNYYSEDSNFDASFSAFEEGLKNSESDRISINYNYAIALERGGNLQKAKSKILEIFSDQRFPEDINANLYFMILALHCSFCNQDKKYKEVISFLEQEKIIISKYDTEAFSECASFFAEIATSYFMIGDEEHANHYFNQAINSDKNNKKVQWLYREMNKNQTFSNAKYFRIVINGRWPEPLDHEADFPCFVTMYEVVADDQAEAFDMIKRFESKKLHDALKIEEVEIVNQAPIQPKGVYETSGYTFYKENTK